MEIEGECGCGAKFRVKAKYETEASTAYAAFLAAHVHCQSSNLRITDTKLDEPDGYYLPYAGRPLGFRPFRHVLG